MARAATSKSLFDFRRYGDIVLALGVMAIMGLMVLRLPTVFIDALVAINIGCGIALLLIALYLPHPVSFSSFPSVLLISTLFRLSLSVATTRLILLDAHAGHIIDAFGHFVAGGNLVVGIVVFIIITIVQFIVIAKGAERVAEVAARFTLDAMPGKQLSIDSDLRSGLIDKDEAKRKRGLLEKESQLHGALDGAMKFVKGDAIASIIIVIVNLLGGLTIGVLQRGLPAGEAVELYSILTIGDGMVAQIPALLSAMAAGLVVTRGAGDGHDGHLGESIGRQVIAHPRALMMTGFIALLFAFVPGFPALIFIAIAAGAFALARYAMGQARKADADAPNFSQSHGRRAQHEGSAHAASSPHGAIAQPLTIELRPGILEPAALSDLRQASFEAVANRGASLGIQLPEPAISIGQPDAPAWRILIFDDVVAASDPAAAFDAEALQRELQAVLTRHADRYIGVQEVSDLLDAAAEQYPALVKEVQRQVPVQRIAEVVRNLLREGIPVRSLRDVLEALAEWSGREKDTGNLTEFVRMQLKRYMTSRFADADRRINALIVDGATEDLVRRALTETPAGMMLMLPRQKITELRESVRAALAQINAATPVLITSVDLRRHLRQVLEPIRPSLPVISYQELLPDVEIQPLGIVRFQTESK
jgi:type III secretion protein V